MKFKTALIDGDFILYSATYGNKKLDLKGQPLLDDWGRFIIEPKTLDQVLESVDFFINDIMSKLECTEYLGFLTLDRCFRYKVDGEYKANRRFKEKPVFFYECRRYLLEKWKFQFEPELEADDLVNIYKNKLGETSIIVSPDKDLLNLVGTHFNPKKGEIKNTNKLESDLYFWKSMLTGDTADNIKGIPGVGSVRADKVLGESEVLLYEQVLSHYIAKFGEYKGIEEFYKNYKLLKILEEQEGINFVEPIPYNINIEFQEKITIKEELGNN